MKSKFKYWLTLFLVVIVNGSISATEAGQSVRSCAVAGMTLSGAKYWDQSPSLAEFIYRERVRYDLKTAFDFMFTEKYILSSPKSEEEFITEFKQIGERRIRPNLVRSCKCCSTENDLIYQHTNTEIVNLALRYRSLILNNTKIWYQHEKSFIPVAPIDDFVFEGEKTIAKISLKLHVVATKIQKNFRSHRAVLHERVYAAHVAKVVADNMAAAKIQAVVRGYEVRQKKAARAIVIDAR